VTKGESFTRAWPFVLRERPSKRGAVLVVDSHVPEPDRNAGDLYMLQYMNVLKAAGFKVVFLAHDRRTRHPYVDDLQQMGVETLYGPFDEAAWLRENGSHIQSVVLARPEIATAHLPLIRRNTSAKVIYYTHDLHFLREQRRHQLTGDTAALEASRRLLGIEEFLCRSVDYVATPSSGEVDEIEKLGAMRVTVWPPYVESTPATPAAAGRRDVIFVGGYIHLPNIDAATYLVNAVMPFVWAELPETNVMLVGDAPSREVLALAGPRVKVTGFVPDLAPYYASAGVSANPLRYGAGLKGKVLASLAARVPVVTTTIGNEGIGLTDGVDALIREDAERSARAITQVLQDDALADRLRTNGVELVERRFSKHVTADAILSTLDELLGVAA
jgi:glycosyltransferase involved in cell wall biosynthesis